eukprot:1880867-Pyramimonas_sp.AAC.1
MNFHEKYGWRARCNHLDKRWTVPQRMLDSRVEEGERQALIKWTALGYEACTWEVEEQLTIRDPAL